MLAKNLQGLAIVGENGHQSIFKEKKKKEIWFAHNIFSFFFLLILLFS